MAERLAVDGGTPVRTAPWPEMYPGGMLFDDEEKRAAIEVIESRSPFRYYGVNLLHKVEQLEKAYSSLIGARFGLAVGSGSAALNVALAALGVGPGTEVILPGFMWVSDMNAVVNLRGIPVLSEIDDSLTLDPEDLERRITPRTKAIVAVHMAGSAANIPAILDIANRRGIPVLEDCSQAAGAEIGGRKVGSLTQIGATSLQYNKNFTTGEGGMVTTSDEALFRRAICFHDLGFERNMQGISSPEGGGFETYGFGTRMDELRGAIGVVQVRRLPEIVGGMRRRQLSLRAAIRDIPGITLRRLWDEKGDSGSCLTWFHKDNATALRFGAAMQAEGVPVHEAHGGLHQYRFMTSLLKKVPVTTEGCPWTCPFNQASSMEFKAGMLPRTDSLLDRARLAFLPPTMTDQDEEDLLRAFRKVAEAIL